MNGALTAVWPGQPYPLGASWDGEGVNFALFSEHAEKVELCLFDQRGRCETARIKSRHLFLSPGDQDVRTISCPREKPAHFRPAVKAIK